MRTGAILAALATASTAHAHATFQYLWVDGVDQGNKCTRAPSNNSPITDLTSNTMACNTNGEVAAAATCPIEAGSKVAVEMHQQPGDRNCETEAIGGNHDGPTIIYMAKVENAATAVGSEANWFKVAETGLVSKDYWGSDVMNANCGKVEFTIPADLQAGNYLIRAEEIALHVAGSAGGAQLYMSCYQISVTGGGAASPATVKFPGAYSASDPGILFNLYGDYSSYTIPGPAVYSAGGASSGESPATTAAATTAAPTTAAAPATSAVTSNAPTATEAESSVVISDAVPTEATATTEATSAPVATTEASATSVVTTEDAPTSVATTEVAPTSVAATSVESAVVTTPSAATTTATNAAPVASGTVAKYYQCGGMNWTGATGCVSGTSCVIQNPYYHQCL
ncbi:glycosyl hydrolase family 61-domain-containing protein [Rhizoctonia solani]|nr:glycosyl hydrolase family 61-domain-containing protein [Rhizoctonia solani]